MRKLIFLFVLKVCVSTLWAMEIEQQLAVGNKTFRIIDLARLPDDQKIALSDMSNPPCILGLCGVTNKVVTSENLQKLRNMPKYITEGMIVSRCSREKIYQDNRLSYCANGTICCCIAGLCGASWVWMFTKCNMSTNAFAALFGGFLGVSATPCMTCVIYTGSELCCCRDVREVKL